MIIEAEKSKDMQVKEESWKPRMANGVVQRLADLKPRRVETQEESEGTK